MEFKTDEGYDESITFQVADVNKPLMSISDRVDKNCRVVFDQDDATGEDMTHIYNKKTKKRMKMKRIGKVWILDCTVTKDFISESKRGFQQAGQVTSSSGPIRPQKMDVDVADNADNEQVVGKEEHKAGGDE